jgi:hypothetical protein
MTGTKAQEAAGIVATTHARAPQTAAYPRGPPSRASALDWLLTQDQIPWPLREKGPL